MPCTKIHFDYLRLHTCECTSNRFPDVHFIPTHLLTRSDFTCTAHMVHTCIPLIYGWFIHHCFIESYVVDTNLFSTTVFLVSYPMRRKFEGA